MGSLDHPLLSQKLTLVFWVFLNSLNSFCSPYENCLIESLNDEVLEWTISLKVSSPDANDGTDTKKINITSIIMHNNCAK